MRTPFPYAGSKFSQREAIWRHLGDPDHFIDPFCGSCSVLLTRPWPISVLLTRPWPSKQRKSEIINDRWGFITNFWRAVKYRPKLVAKYCLDMPNELDMHSRHAWLQAREQTLERSLRADVHYYDAKIAGWFCWGISIWFRHGWCKGYQHDVGSRLMNVDGNKQKGVFRTKLGTDSKRQLANEGEQSRSENVPVFFEELAQRMERVSVLCGHWRRCVDYIPRQGIVAVFLDPPYSTDVRKEGQYKHDGGPELSRKVREWAVQHGDDPRLRIAFCGLADEHEMPKMWIEHRWTNGGGANGRKHLERIWFSPHCLP